MTWSFAEHFAALGAGSSDPPGAEEVWADLCRALEAELRRRGLWGAPPAYVGVVGWHHWDRDALDELAGECYLYQLARLRGLGAQLRAGADLDRFVLLNIRHFVFERQRGNDPLGYRVFQVVVQALQRAAATGRLVLPADGEARLRNDAVIALGREARNAPPASPKTLDALARHWNDDLLPALVTARGRPQRDALVDRLADHLAALPAAGVLAFRLGDLVEPLKADARRRWAALSEEGEKIAAELATDGSPATVVPVVLPDTSVEDREQFDRLVACTAGRIARLPAGQGAGELLSLLSLLARHARDDSSGRPPSQRSLARDAAVPRHRLGARLERLRELVAACERAIGAAKPVSGVGWRRPHGEGS